MRISDTSTGQGVLVEREEDDSQELGVIATRIMPEWLALFARKNRDYGSGSAYELGVRGQYSDIHRKMIKLKRAMWDGEQLDFEDTDEIIKDLISHLFLTLHMFGLQREDEEQTEHAASIRQAVLSERASRAAEAVQQDLMAARLKRSADERVYGAREARRKAREADGSPGEATLRAMAETGAYGFRVRSDEDAVNAMASDEFAEGDFEQHHNHFPCGAELKVGPPRIITEQVDGRTRYYHEAYPGADREPLSLVPTALIERAQKDHHVMSKEQEAGLRTLASWIDRS